MILDSSETARKLYRGGGKEAAREIRGVAVRSMASLRGSPNHHTITPSHLDFKSVCTGPPPPPPPPTPPGQSSGIVPFRALGGTVPELCEHVARPALAQASPRRRVARLPARPTCLLSPSPSAAHRARLQPCRLPRPLTATDSTAVLQSLRSLHTYLARALAWPRR